MSEDSNPLHSIHIDQLWRAFAGAWLCLAALCGQAKIGPCCGQLHGCDVILVGAGSCARLVLCPLGCVQVWDNLGTEELNKVLRPNLLKPVVPLKAARAGAEAVVEYTLRKSADPAHQDNTTVLVVAFLD